MEPTTTTGLSVLSDEIQKIGGLFDGIGAVGDDDAVGFVFVEDLVNGAHQVEPVFVDQRVAWQASKRDFRNLGDLLQLGQHLEDLAVFQALASFDVPCEVKPVLAHGIDGAAGDDQCDSG